MSARCLIVCLLSAALLSASVGRAEEARPNQEVCVEVQFVSITAEVLQELQQNGLLDKHDPKRHGPVTFLDDAGRKRFTEAIQQDFHTNVMQAPKMTMFNGQNVKFDAGDKQFFTTGLEIVSCGDHLEYRPKTEVVPLGVRMNLRSVIAADRRSVRVDLDAHMSNLESADVPKLPITTPDPNKPISPDGKPQTVTHYIQRPRITKVDVKRTLNIPDGHTAVLMAATKKCVAANKYGPPILSDLPIVGRLFTTIGYHSETQHLLVLVTPRIHIEAEKEEKRTQKEDYRTLIIPAVRAGDAEQSNEPPDEARVVRALPRLVCVPGLFEEHRDNIQIVTERIVDRTDPPRVFPLIGLARLHHCGWKCTVYYNETITGSYPFAFRYSAPRIHLVFMDTDRLLLEDPANGK